MHDTSDMFPWQLPEGGSCTLSSTTMVTRSHTPNYLPTNIRTFFILCFSFFSINFLTTFSFRAAFFASLFSFFSAFLAFIFSFFSTIVVYIHIRHTHTDTHIYIYTHTHHHHHHHQSINHSCPGRLSFLTSIIIHMDLLIAFLHRPAAD